MKPSYKGSFHKTFTTLADAEALADQGLDRQAVLGWASDLIAQIHGRADRHGWELDEADLAQLSVFNLLIDGIDAGDFDQ